MNDDLISREDLNKTIDKITWYHINPHGELVEGSHDDSDALFKAEDIYKVIDNAPTVNFPNYGGQVVPDMLQGWSYDERPQGEWKVYGRQGGIPISDYCTNCKYEMKWYKTKYNFCPNCGAKMKGGAE